MKKQLLCILSILLVFSLAACAAKKPVEEEKEPVKLPTIKEESAEKREGRCPSQPQGIEDHADPGYFVFYGSACNAAAGPQRHSGRNPEPERRSGGL